ncbi:MAG: PDZ domain-containing protein [Acidobacteria bacterium]|nr:PDZ domain-containing protein [Acidobacteriota bacterium]
MKTSGIALALSLAAAALVLPPARFGGQADPFAAFWRARSPDEAESAARGILEGGIGFDEAWTRLRRGRSYASSVPRGLVRLRRSAGGLAYVYHVEVPDTYDPSRRYQVRVQLHGGVMGRETGAPRGAGTIGALAGAEQIYVMPFAWRDAPWWSERQEENLAAILDALKRTYNVDENHIALAGVSDGATAAYYFAMRQPTIFSSFLALNGHLMVLESPSLRIGELFPNNLLNRPLFVVNGGLDPLYPAASVGPWVEHLQRRGVDVEYRVQPDGVHDTRWWPRVEEGFEAFVREHPRDPYPPRVTWSTDRTDAHSRIAWLVVDRLAGNAGAAGLPRPDLTADVNVLQRDLSFTFGIVGAGTRVSLIQPGSNAERFGLRPGDTIAAVNGRPCADAEDLLRAAAALEPGAAVSIVATRGSGRVELAGTFEPNPPGALLLFDRRRPWGRVDAVRRGNTVTVQSYGVAAFTLLLSPDVFDFSKPITVVVNGGVRFQGRVERSLATLLKWAARDNDRTMLFGAELTLEM